MPQQMIQNKTIILRTGENGIIDFGNRMEGKALKNSKGELQHTDGALEQAILNKSSSSDFVSVTKHP